MDIEATMVLELLEWFKTIRKERCELIAEDNDENNADLVVESTAAMRGIMMKIVRLVQGTFHLLHQPLLRLTWFWAQIRQPLLLLQSVRKNQVLSKRLGLLWLLSERMISQLLSIIPIHCVRPAHFLPQSARRESKQLYPLWLRFEITINQLLSSIMTA